MLERVKATSLGTVRLRRGSGATFMPEAKGNQSPPCQAQAKAKAHTWQFPFVPLSEFKSLSCKVLVQRPKSKILGLGKNKVYLSSSLAKSSIMIIRLRRGHNQMQSLPNSTRLL